MTRMPANTKPNPASTRCSIDHPANLLGNHLFGSIGAFGSAGGSSDGAGGTAGVGAECSCVADSMAQAQIERSGPVITFGTLLWPFRPCKQYLRSPSPLG